jgi:hypothetical protein
VQYINVPPLIEGFDKESSFDLPVIVHSTPSGVSNWILAFTSPPVSDIEGDKIYIKLEKKHKNIKLIPTDESFELLYDQGRLSNPPETLTVILKNEDSMFPNKYFFNLQIEVVDTDVSEKIAELVLPQEVVAEEPQEEEEDVVTK